MSKLCDINLSSNKILFRFVNTQLNVLSSFSIQLLQFSLTSLFPFISPYTYTSKFYMSLFPHSTFFLPYFFVIPLYLLFSVFMYPLAYQSFLSLSYSLFYSLSLSQFRLPTSFFTSFLPLYPLSSWFDFSIRLCI